MKTRNLFILFVVVLICSVVFFGEKNEAVASTEKEGPVTITVWWWGEQEAKGLEPWMNETVKKFEQELLGI